MALYYGGPRKGSVNVYLKPGYFLVRLLRSGNKMGSSVLPHRLTRIWPRDGAREVFVDLN